MKEIKLKNQLTEVESLHVFVDEVCKEVGMDDMVIDMINLALEELVVNVINYAWNPGEDADFTVSSDFNDGKIRFVITDGGKPFDPTAEVAEADTSLSAEDRPIGGLGVYLAKNIMDKMEYKRENDKNILTVEKSI